MNRARNSTSSPFPEAGAQLPIVIIGCFLSLACLTGSYQVKAGERASDPLAHTREVEDELRKLNESEIGRQIADLEARASGYDKERFTVQDQFLKLQRTEAYREYAKQRTALLNKLDTNWPVERKAMAEAARKIYAARHDELQSLAVKDVTHARELGLDVLTFPRMDGSTSTHPLNVIVACRVLGAPYEWLYPEPSGYPWSVTPPVPLELFLVPDIGETDWGSTNYEFNLSASRVVAKPSRTGGQRMAIMINSLLATNNSTHDAYVNLIEGKCDLNLSARAPSDEETKLARTKGVKLELQPIAKDALVFIVNQQNGVRTVSSAQIRQIYEDKIKTWKELGGQTNAILALWRERNSGSRELFDMLVTKGSPLPEPKDRWAKELLANSMGGPFNRVTQESGGLGYSVYYYEHFMSLSPYTRLLAIDGVEPNAETIASGKYPWTANVYAAYRADEPAAGPAMKILNWLLSPEGQAVVRESGYVPVK